MARRRKYTKENLEPHVQQSFNWASLLVSLGLKQTGGNHRLIKQRLLEYEIDFSHFDSNGRSWAKGRTKENDERLLRGAKARRTPDEEVFCLNSGYKSSDLYKRLLEKGFENKCSLCEIEEWRNKPIRFHVDHINGDHIDNRINNLRFLCPNCHSQTNTYSGRNRNNGRMVK